MALDLTKAEFETWLDDRSTRVILAFLRTDIENAKDTLARGGTYNAESAEQTHGGTAYMIGFIAGLRRLLELKDAIWETADVH